MKGKFISRQAHQCAKLLAEVCFQSLMFEEVYLTITVCFSRVAQLWSAVAEKRDWLVILTHGALI